jgi:RNA recognition motif-containing protein
VTYRNRLAVGNIPYDATEQQLIDIFKEVGNVVNFRYVAKLVLHGQSIVVIQVNQYCCPVGCCVVLCCVVLCCVVLCCVVLCCVVMWLVSDWCLIRILESPKDMASVNTPMQRQPSLPFAIICITLVTMHTVHTCCLYRYLPVTYRSCLLFDRRSSPT